MTPRIGVCSWSLQAGSPGELAERAVACDLGSVQLALEPIRSGDWDVDETRDALLARGIHVLSGMTATAGEDYSSLESIRITGGVRPDVHWQENLAIVAADARIAAALGLELVTLHAGFIPEERRSAERRTMIARLREVVDVFAGEGVAVGFETGQETAECLLAALADIDRDTAGVNFDPANMVLYGKGDPVAALDALAPHVLQIHVKDALPATAPGTWGTEVPVGVGFVDWEAFFATRARRGITCDLVIERESGERRFEDVRTAHDLVRGLLERVA